MNELEQLKHAKYVKIAKYGGLALIAALLLPIIFDLALMAAGTAAAVAFTAIVGLALVNFLPLLSMKFANWKLKGMKAEAAQNPIETMENEHLTMTQEVERFKAALAESKGNFKVFTDDVADLRKTDPEGADEYNQEIADYETELASQEQILHDDIVALEKYREHIDKMKRRWSTMLKSDALRKARPGARDQALRAMLSEAATEAVRQRAAAAASRLNVDALANTARSDYKKSKAQQATLGKSNPTLLEVHADKVYEPVKRG